MDCKCLVRPCIIPSEGHEECPECGEYQSPLVGGPGYRKVKYHNNKEGEPIIDSIIAEGSNNRPLVCGACGMPYGRISQKVEI